jgi:hypothetical protein
MNRLRLRCCSSTRSGRNEGNPEISDQIWAVSKCVTFVTDRYCIRIRYVQKATNQDSFSFVFAGRQVGGNSRYQQYHVPGTNSHSSLPVDYSYSCCCAGMVFEWYKKKASQLMIAITTHDLEFDSCFLIFLKGLFTGSDYQQFGAYPRRSPLARRCTYVRSR